MSNSMYWRGYAQACLERGINPRQLQKQAVLVGGYDIPAEAFGALTGGGVGTLAGYALGGGGGALAGGLGGAALGASGVAGAKALGFGLPGSSGASAGASAPSLKPKAAPHNLSPAKYVVPPAPVSAGSAAVAHGAPSKVSVRGGGAAAGGAAAEAAPSKAPVSSGGAAASKTGPSPLDALRALFRAKTPPARQAAPTRDELLDMVYEYGVELVPEGYRDYARQLDEERRGYLRNLYFPNAHEPDPAGR